MMNHHLSSATAHINLVLDSATAAAVTRMQCARLVARWFDTLERVRTDDAALDLALDLAAERVRSWSEAMPDPEVFEDHWWQVSAVVSLAHRSYTGPADSPYRRLLSDMDAGMLAMPELWEVES